MGVPHSVQLSTHSTRYLNGDIPVGKIRFICRVIVLYHPQVRIIAQWVQLHITREGESTSIRDISCNEEILFWYRVVQCDPQNSYFSMFRKVICVHNECGVFNNIDGGLILIVALFGRGACDFGRFVVQRLDINDDIECSSAGEAPLISDDHLQVHVCLCVYVCV